MERLAQSFADGGDDVYQRFGHPTTTVVAEKIRALEGAEAALLFGQRLERVPPRATGILEHLTLEDQRWLLRGHHVRFGLAPVLKQRAQGGREPADKKRPEKAAIKAVHEQVERRI